MCPTSHLVHLLVKSLDNFSNVSLWIYDRYQVMVVLNIYLSYC